MTEDPITLGNESDIWTFDVASGTITDLTNDNVEGSWISQTGYELDYLPMWSPDGESIDSGVAFRFKCQSASRCN